MKNWIIASIAVVLVFAIVFMGIYFVPYVFLGVFIVSMFVFIIYVIKTMLDEYGSKDD